MENGLDNISKQELIERLLAFEKSNQNLEVSNLEKERLISQKEDVITQKEEDIPRLNLIVANLQRMLFGSKKDRFISKDAAQLTIQDRCIIPLRDFLGFSP